MTDIANLGTLATANTYRTRGSRLPHAQIQYWFDDGTDDRYLIGDWMNRHEPTATLLNQALAVPIIPVALVTEAAATWGVDTSLVGSILDTFYFTLAQPADWCDPAAAGARQTFALKAGTSPATAAEKEFFMHLTASRAAIYYRETTMGTLNLDVVVLSTRRPGAHVSQATNVALNWTKVLREFRREVKSRLNRRAAPFPYTAAGYLTYDTLIFELLRDQVRGGFATLITAGVLRAPHGSYEFSNTPAAHLGDTLPVAAGFADQISTALNHVRFVMYMEWRIGYELITRALLP
jgi:hypothetical protein